MPPYKALKRSCAVLLALAALAGCGNSPKTIVVGSMNSTEQLLLGEIVAQHLENRLGRKVYRRRNLGGTASAYQALQNGEIDLYPEYAGSVVTQILKEQPAADATLVFERARREMKRLAQADLLNPLGIDNPFVAVIGADDPRASKVSTLSDAAAVGATARAGEVLGNNSGNDGWILGASPEFQQLSDGMAALLQYKLPLKAAPRSFDGDLLIKALQQSVVTMILVRATDAILSQPRWKMLRDDRHVFIPKQACLLVQENLLLTQPRVRPALEELSGKFTTEKMRQLNAMVDLNQRQLTEVADSFLKQSGLK